MIPSLFVPLSELPLAPTDKIDRHALPPPDLTKLLQTTFVAPQTSTEKTLAIIWQTILKQEQVGIQDDFFELGGHSLLATQIMSRIREAFNFELPLRTLFECTTIVTLAKHIDILQKTQSSLTSEINENEFEEEIW